MMKYNILVIDEQITEIEQFQNFFELADDFNVFGLSEIATDEDLYTFINDNRVDAVAFDYKLMEYESPFQKNGDKYLKGLLERYQSFPALMLTNKVGDAKKHNIDPFRIIDKSLININPEIDVEKQKGLDLIQDIRLLIDNYKKDIEDKENELKNLLERLKKGEILNLEDNQRINELDDFLENTFSKIDKIPKEFKDNKTLDTLSKLVAQTDALIQRIKDK